MDGHRPLWEEGRRNSQVGSSAFGNSEFPVAKASLMLAPWRGPCGGRVGEEFESFRGVERWETFQPLLRVLFLGSQAI